MPADLIIEPAWERTDEGSAAERACFAELRIAVGQTTLSEGYDAFVNRLRAGPLVSAYHAAEWFAWNWWRLRWEPRTTRIDWPFAHQMATIGEGYLWPNVTVQSDGVRIVLIAKPSVRADSKPFRFICDRAAIIPAAAFEAGVDTFIAQVLDRLTTEQVGQTNLHALWRDLKAERDDPMVALRRRLEALIGAEPDAVSDSEQDLSSAANLNDLMAGVADWGVEPIAELAAHEGKQGHRIALSRLWEQATAVGQSAGPSDAVHLTDPSVLPRFGEVAAWRRGAAAAQALRKQERLGTAPIANRRLEEMAGARDGTVADRNTTGELPFSIETGTPSIVLRSKWREGRRFELARLLGDRLAGPSADPLRPATRAYTYRQKMQRSFAAELLSPFDKVEHMLGGDLSDERQEEVARYFKVSERTIRTLLVNHGLLDRDELDETFDLVA